MSELGPDENAWLDVLRKADEPTPADRERVRARVVAGLATAGGATAAASSLGKLGKLGKTSGLLGGAWKVGLATLSMGALIGGGLWSASSATTHTAATAQVRTKLEADPLEPAPAEGTAAHESAAEDDPGVPGGYGVQPEPAVRTGRSTVQAKHPHDDIEAELGLLSRAQRALSAHDPMLALQLLGNHRALFPRGALHVEREGLYAVAACEAKRPEGSKLGTRFLRDFPASPLGARVQAACLSR